VSPPASTPPSHRVVIRLANEKDAASIAGLLAELGYPCSAKQYKQRADQFNRADCYTFVATTEDLITGFIGLQKTYVYTQDKPVGWITALVVSRRMRREGVGTALLVKAEQVLSEDGIENIYLHSARTNLEAHMFYKSRGYIDSALRFTKSLKGDLA
jgi:N-acetylglutamate synthase-like GNAT family acetyltransferase